AALAAGDGLDPAQRHPQPSRRRRTAQAMAARLRRLARCRQRQPGRAWLAGIDARIARAAARPLAARARVAGAHHRAATADRTAVRRTRGPAAVHPLGGRRIAHLEAALVGTPAPTAAARRLAARLAGRTAVPARWRR